MATSGSGPGRGGYQKPSNPAGASGPGALSKRTDGRPQPIRDIEGGDYGDRQEMREMQQAAPLPTTSAPSMDSGAAMAPQGPPMTPFSAPSARPDEPVTAGAAAGPGSGPEALGLPTSGDIRKEDAARLQAYLPLLIRMANRPEATPSFRNYVRSVRGTL